ncbi:hypothetical protein PENTCL1PPCAC_19206, partial [Pristionchus entomophagus]
VFAVMTQNAVTEKRKEGGEETEKQDERVLLEEEWYSTMEAVHICILRGLKMIERKDIEEFEQRSEAIDRLFRAKSEFEHKEGRAPEEYGEDAKKVLNQLAETLVVFGYSKEEVGDSIFMRIDKLQSWRNSRRNWRIKRRKMRDWKPRRRGSRWKIRK